MLRRLLQVFSALALVGLIGLAAGVVRLAADPADPADRVERIVACFKRLGYSISAYHDDGREPLVGPDSDPDMKVLFGGATRASSAAVEPHHCVPPRLGRCDGRPPGFGRIGEHHV